MGFCLSPSGCADIYNLFGIFANIGQEVNVLPFERFDRAKALIAKFMKMMNAMNHSDCPGSGEKCLWPNYHADLSAMESDGKFMNTGIDHVNIGKIRQTRPRLRMDSWK